MSVTELASLAVLALVDSTSAGTLLLPVWFMLAPGRLRPSRLLVFLGTVAGFYLVVGLLLAAGAHALLDRTADAAGTPVGTWLQLLLGGSMVVASFFLGPKKDADGNPRRGRLSRWRDRAVAGDDDGARGHLPLVALAVGAAGIELATMLPYLAAIGVLTNADLEPWPRAGVLAAYCLVMVLPALLLLAVRVVAHRWVAPVLERLGTWLERAGSEATAWAIGIVGFLLARNALTRLPDLGQVFSGGLFGGWGG